MQLGITIPLQKYLKLKSITYGEPVDLFFCWELHRITYQGKNCLMIVNANNRFSILLYGINAAQWKQLSACVEEGIRRGMEDEGYTKEQIELYFNLAGESTLTKTHGRKPVAGLNRAIDFLLYNFNPCDANDLYQSEHTKDINRDICKPIGFEEYGCPVDFLKEDMRRVGIMK